MQLIRYLILIIAFISLASCLKPASTNKTASESNVRESIPLPNFTALKAHRAASASTPTHILQIDSGGHTARIHNIVFTPDGRHLVSASHDKLIRVWDIKTGRTVRTLRGQISTGDEGKIYAMALSPDGRWLAVGGFMAPGHGIRDDDIDDIRLYDFPTGKLVARLKGHTNAVLSLAFSPDGRFLVSSCKVAILWEVESKQRLHTLRGHTNVINTVAFTPDSKRIVTGSFDHTLRLWQVQDGGLIATLKGHTHNVFSVAISPQDGVIASGSSDNTIRLWNGQTGDFIKTLADQKTLVNGLSFSPDGRYLVSGVGSMPPYNSHVWSYPAGKEIITYKGHDNAVFATAISPDGRWVATAGGNDQAIHIWSLRDGKLKQRLGGVGSTIMAVGFSADGKSLAWGKTEKSTTKVNNRGPLEYYLTLPTSNRPLGVPRPLKDSNGFLRAQNQWHNWTLGRSKSNSNLLIRTTKLSKAEENTRLWLIYEAHSRNNLAWMPKFNIKRDYTSGIYHSAYTFTPNGQRIISGGNGTLTAYNRYGMKLGDYIGHTGIIMAVAVSPDSRLLVSASEDQTIRLWDVESRENLVTLFHANDGEWVAWTRSGHYTASPNGDKMIGWQINRGVDKAADYVTAEQLREHLYRPNIVNDAIRLRSVSQAVAQAGNSTNVAQTDNTTVVAQTDNTTSPLEQLSTALPPKFKIIKPLNHSKTRKQRLEIVLSFKNDEEPLESLLAYVNGSLVDNQKKWALGQATDSYEKKLTLPLQPGENKIRLVAKNRIGITTRDLQVQLEGSHSKQQGTLYLVAVGVSEYQNPAHNLRYAAIDARDIHEYLIKQQGKQYARVETRLLADGATRPTAANIKAALDLFKQATAADTVILFLSGHGDNQGADYYFLPYDAQENNPNSLIKWQILQKTLEESKGRRLLLVDTCHAGGAYNPRLVKDAADNNIVVISATDEKSFAEELTNLGHGVFTYALLEGLGGKADLLGDDKTITIKELDNYLDFTVEALTNGRQKPVLHAPGGFKNFVFARL